MKLTEVFMGTLATEQSGQSQTKRAEQTGQSFDTFMERQDAAEKTQPKVKSGAAARKDRPTSRKADKEPTPTTQKDNGKSEAAASNDSTVKTDNKVKTGETDAVKKPEEAKKPEAAESATEAEMALASVNAEIMKELAKLLNMTEESLAEIFNSLGIQPADLANKDNMLQFLQAVNKAEDPAALLNVPDIAKVMAGAEDIVAKVIQALAPNDEPVTAKPQADAKPEAEAAPVTKADTLPEKAVANGLQKPVVNPEEQAAENARPEAKAEPEPERRLEPAAKAFENDGDNTAFEQNPNRADANLNPANMANAANVPVRDNQDVQFARAAVRSEAASNLNTADVVSQLIDKLKVEVRGNVSEVRITLHPESLGDVSMKVSTQNGIVTAHFIAENQRVKEIIEANFGQLKETLTEQGIQIAGLSVSVEQNERERLMQQFMNGQQTASRRLSRITGQQPGAEQTQTEADVVNDGDVYEAQVDYRA